MLFRISLRNSLHGLYSLSGWTSCRKISRSLEAGRFRSRLFQSLWNLTGISAALLPRCLSNFKTIWSLWHPILRPRDFARSYGKTSVPLVNRGPISSIMKELYHVRSLIASKRIGVKMFVSFWSFAQPCAITAEHPQQLWTNWKDLNNGLAPSRPYDKMSAGLKWQWNGYMSFFITSYEVALWVYILLVCRVHGKGIVKQWAVSRWLIGTTVWFSYRFVHFINKHVELVCLK